MKCSMDEIEGKEEQVYESMESKLGEWRQLTCNLLAYFPALSILSFCYEVEVL